MRFNKKGQSEWYMIGLVIAVLVLVVVVVGILNVKKTGEEFSAAIPDKEKTVLLGYCDNSIFKNSVARYCTDYKEGSMGSFLSSKTVYYNCYDIYKKFNVKPTINCSDSEYAKQGCIYLAGQGELNSGDTVYISGKTCLYTAPTQIEYAKIVVNGQPISVDSNLVASYPSLDRLPFA